MSNRLNPEVRKDSIMQHAMTLARMHGYTRISRENIAQAAGVAPSLVSKYWGTMAQVQRAIMRNAVKNEDLAIIAQGLVARDRQAMRAPEETRQRAVTSLV